jgi:hypothetical protein
MPKPTSKRELLSAIDKERGTLLALLDSLTAEQMVEPGIVGEWSVQDVLAHLTAWEQLCLGWYRAGLSGETPEMPAPGFKWEETPALNRQIYEQNRERPLADVLQDFQKSHQEILGVVQSLSNDDLFTPGKVAWTGKNTMGTYFVSATSSHYLWAWSEIRKGFRDKEQAAV